MHNSNRCEVLDRVNTAKKYKNPPSIWPRLMLLVSGQAGLSRLVSKGLKNVSIQTAFGSGLVRWFVAGIDMMQSSMCFHIYHRCLVITIVM